MDRTPTPLQRLSLSGLCDKALMGCSYAHARNGDWKFRTLSAAVADAVIILDRHGRIQHWNSAAEAMFGDSASDANGREFFHLVARGGSKELLMPENCPGDEFGRKLEMTVKRNTGEEFPVELTIFDSCPEGSCGALVVARNPAADALAAALVDASRQRLDYLVRKRREIEQSFWQRQQRDKRLIWQLMHHDPLTGLPNRLLLQERLSLATAQAEGSGRHVGVLMVGIHHFKYINDTLGAGVGDFLLTTVAARLSQSIGESDTVARLEGDGFAVILPDLRKADLAEEVAERLLAALKEPIAVVGHELVLAASIGISIFPRDGTDPESLVKHAGAAMCLAKKEGDSSWRNYAVEYHACALARLELEEDLRRALENGQLEVHYQPQVDLRRGMIDGAEALLRWNRPGHGQVSPTQFIPLAEEIGLIVPIGAWVLETSCLQLKAWQKEGAEDLRMAVNLSARQFRQKELGQEVQEILWRTGVQPDALELEITESMLMQNFQQSHAVLQEFRQQGVRLALDDFGTGYSSLNYLKRFPINTVKVDRSFVRRIPRDGKDTAIVQAIIGLAHGLELKVVAEGVETEQQLDFMQTHGCDKVQGYFFSPPVEAGAFCELLSAGPPSRGMP